MDQGYDSVRFSLICARHVFEFLNRSGYQSGETILFADYRIKIVKHVSGPSLDASQIAALVQHKFQINLILPPQNKDR